MEKYEETDIWPEKKSASGISPPKIEISSNRVPSTSVSLRSLMDISDFPLLSPEPG